MDINNGPHRDLCPAQRFALVTNQTIELTQLGGFNQFWLMT